MRRWCWHVSQYTPSVASAADFNTHSATLSVGGGASYPNNAATDELPTVPDSLIGLFDCRRQVAHHRQNNRCNRSGRNLDSVEEQDGRWCRWRTWCAAHRAIKSQPSAQSCYMVDVDVHDRCARGQITHVTAHNVVLAVQKRIFEEDTTVCSVLGVHAHCVVRSHEPKSW